MDSPERISRNEVERVARLARLRLEAREIDRLQADLSSILAHVSLLRELDVETVEPLWSPIDSQADSNRLANDEPQPPMAIEAMELNAPAMEGRFLAVPKVIGDGTEGA
jgi:aspartyl-tRNA(Asn)/glutamyl-tRNA(Gln) amidotransferase subunit C